MIETFKATIDVPRGYELLLNAFKAALERASAGKGRQRHAKHDNQPLEEQDIYNFTHEWRMDQMQKKVKELPRIKGRRDRANETLDVAIYAMVEWDKILADLNKEIASVRKED